MADFDVCLLFAINRIERLIRKFGLPDEPITLALYEDDESLKFFRPTEFKNNAEHTAFIFKLKAELERYFYPLKFETKTIILSDYWRHLARTGAKDSPAERTRFLAIEENKKNKEK